MEAKDAIRLERKGRQGMRTIKFRAWDKENKRMYQPCFVWGDIQPTNGLPLREFVNEFRDDWMYGNGNIVLEQWTGLVDKHGKEIYEGDVILWGDKLARERGTAITVTVEFRSGCFGIFDGKHFHEFWHYMAKDWSLGELEWGDLNMQDYFRACFEVIGTIHDKEVQV